jgi:hypothetical protein
MRDTAGLAAMREREGRAMRLLWCGGCPYRTCVGAPSTLSNDEYHKRNRDAAEAAGMEREEGE